MPAYKPPGNPKKETPTQWKTPPDARDTGGEYPNYYVKKSRSGHVMIMDDTEGSEHITLQHRGGSQIQFMPDGAIMFVSQNGQYNIVFGENRMLVTGAYDVTVHGGGSLSVDGDYNVTVKGNHNTTVHGDMNMTVKNLNQTVRGNMDTTAKNMTLKVEGSTEMTSHGVTTIASDGGLGLVSTGDAVALGAPGSVGIKAGGKMMLQAEGEMHVKSDSSTFIEATGGSINQKASGEVRTTSGGKHSLQGAQIAMDAGLIVLNEGSSSDADAADDSEVTFKKPTSPNRET